MAAGNRDRLLFPDFLARFGEGFRAGSMANTNEASPQTDEACCMAPVAGS